MIKLSEIVHTYSADVVYLDALYHVDVSIEPGGHMTVVKSTPKLDATGEEAVRCAIAEALRNNVYDAFW